MPLRKTSAGYLCPLGILKNTYLEGFDAADNPVILGNCGMCRFGDRSQGTRLGEMCQAPEGMTFEQSEKLLSEFQQRYKKTTGNELNINDLEHRKAYWIFIRARLER
jgi:hypothetical protein